MANYPQYDYAAASVNLYRTNLYSGTDPDVDGTLRFSDDVDLTQKVFAVCEVTFEASGTTDDLEVSLYRRLDGAWDGDELEILRTTMENYGPEAVWSMTIGPDFGPGHYRFGLKSTGTTDAFDVDLNARLARFEVAAT